MEGPGTGSDISRKVDTSFKDNPSSKRRYVVEDEDLLEMVEQQPSTNTHKLLADLVNAEILKILQNF